MCSTLWVAVVCFVSNSACMPHRQPLITGHCKQEGISKLQISTVYLGPAVTIKWRSTVNEW